MKNSKVTKEQALKAFLLVALVGNLSGLSVEDALKSVDLSSEILSSPTSAPPVQSAPLSMSPNALSLQDSKTPKIQVGSVPVITRGSVAKKNGTAVSTATKPADKPAEVLATSKATTYTGKIRVCDVSLHLSFAEAIDNGQQKTIVTIKEMVESENPEDNVSLQVKVLGSLVDNGISPSSPNQSAKAEVDRAISQAAEKKLAEMNRCEDKNAPVVQNPPTQKPGGGEVVDNGLPRRRTDRAERGSSGGVERVRGAIKKIGRLADFNDDNEARGRTRAARELERLVKSDIYPSLKNLLLRRDSSGEAQELIDEAIEEVESAGRDAGMNNNTVARLVGSLRGLKAGAETYSRSVEMADEVKALRKDIQDARQQYGGQVPTEYYQQMQELSNRMQQEITMASYQQLTQYRAYMQAAELTQFTQPYQNLQREIQSLAMGGQQMPGQMGMPGQLGGNNFGAGLNGMNGMIGQPNMMQGSPILGQQTPFMMNGMQNGIQSPFMQNQNLMLNRPMVAQPMPFMNQGINPMFTQQPGMLNQGFMQQPTPFMNNQPMLAQGNFGYGNPAPFMANQSSVFMNQGLAPQFYSSALPSQSMLSPQVGAYANFQMNLGTPSIFSQNPAIAQPRLFQQQGVGLR